MLAVLERVATGPEKSGEIVLLESQANRRVYQALLTKITVEFQKKPLQDVAAFLADRTGITVLIDKFALEEEKHLTG